MTPEEQRKLGQIEEHLEWNDKRLDAFEKTLSEVNRIVQRGMGAVIAANVIFGIIITLIVAWKH
jgi:hypothetical protein